VATSTRSRADRLPITAGLLAFVQFVAAGAGVVVQLGNGTVDGELAGGDIAKAVGIALVGAAVIGSTTSGGRIGWWVQLVLAPVCLAFGLITMLGDNPPGLPALIVGALWLLLLVLPPTRNWFLRQSV
jgi:hypothetical protein